MDRTKRSLYDKWRTSGLSIPYKQWEDMKAGMTATLHWAVPKQERMLPDGEENLAGAGAEGGGDEAAAGAEAERRKRLRRQG